MADEYHEALGRVAASIHENGDAITNGINFVGNGGHRYKGYSVNRDGNTIAIVGAPDQGHFNVEYHLRFSEHLQEQMTEDDIEGAREKYGRDLDDPQVIEAYLRGALPEAESEETQEIIQRIHRSVQDAQVRLDWPSFGNDDKFWDGFTLFTRIYPREDTYSSREYDQGMNRIIQAASRPISILLDEFEMFNEGDSQMIRSEQESGNQPVPGFQ